MSCEKWRTETQFAFRNDLVLRDVLFCTQVLVQRCLDMNREVFVACIDYEKAFDRVKYEKLVYVMKKVGLDYKDIRIIKNLFRNRTANVGIEGGTIENIDIRRGVIRPPHRGNILQKL